MANWSSIRPSAAVVQLVVLGWVLCAAAPAKAQLQNLYPNFFELQPNVLDVLAFGGGFGSEKYGSIQEGGSSSTSESAAISGWSDGLPATNCGLATILTIHWRRAPAIGRG